MLTCEIKTKLNQTEDFKMAKNASAGNCKFHTFCLLYLKKKTVRHFFIII